MLIATSKSVFEIHDLPKCLCPKRCALKATNEAELKSCGTSLSGSPAE